MFVGQVAMLKPICHIFILICVRVCVDAHVHNMYIYMYMYSKYVYMRVSAYVCFSTNFWSSMYDVCTSVLTYARAC